jgi:carbamoyl-phosphate synthase small subunit
MDEVTLILEDSTEYQGESFGTKRSLSGEVVFNTGMVGYYESLTDPSYKGQILVLTYPLIGNYGVPSERLRDKLSVNFESDRIHASALVVSDYSFSHNHWNAIKSLSDWLKEQGIPAVHRVDTRALTKRLREKGTLLGKIVFDKDVALYDPNKENLIQKVSVQEPVIYNNKGSRKIVVIDCGVKHNILRSLVQRDCCVIRVPCNYDFLDRTFDGVVVSNGPGDPKTCQETIAIVKKCFEKKIPTFGICLGNQLMALAAGADTFKLKYGHRSQNQPCLQVGTQRCFITSQNHGYAVAANSLPKDWEPWFENVNDNTNEGIRHKRLPFISVQFHPEHRPGPVDTSFLFDTFLELLRK